MPTVTEDNKNTTPDMGDDGTTEDTTTSAASVEQGTGTTDDNVKPVKDRTLEEQVAYWKAIARKHEDREKNANKQLGGFADLKQQFEQMQAKLHESEVEAARKDVRLAHPELSEDVFALCGETEPDKIREWGDKAATAFQSASQKEPDMGADNKQSINPEELGTRQAAKSNTGSAAASAPDAKAAIYKRIYEKYSGKKNK